MSRIYLSPPHMSGFELDLVQDAFASNWIAPLGPHVDAFDGVIRLNVNRAYNTLMAVGRPPEAVSALHAGLDCLCVGRRGWRARGRRCQPWVAASSAVTSAGRSCVRTAQTTSWSTDA